MSVTKRGSDIHFYIFDEKGVVLDKKTVSFDFLNTIGASGFSKKAYNYLVTKGIGSSGSLVKMDINTPNAIEITSKPNKLYVVDNQFVFTFDVDKSKTKVIALSPPNFEMTITEFTQSEINEIDFSNNNSYLYDDKIFQIIASSKEMKFLIKDFKSKELLKEIVLKKEDSITFKNTPIIQEGPGFIAGTRTRKMEETSKFLRKISRGDLGIAAYLQNDNYKITLGSKKEISRGGGGFGPMGGFGPISVSFNPTFFAYGGYSSTKSTYIDCLFNYRFEPIKGDVSENVFDRIKAFEKSFKKKTTAKQKISEVDDFDRETDNESDNSSNKPILKNVFRHKGKLYFGFVGIQDRNYHLFEFVD